jgi:hypothetical protein
VGLVWDPGRLSVLAALGLAISDERLTALAGAAVLALDNDAVGIRAGFLPGLGERDARVARARTGGERAPHRHRGPVASDAEVAAASAWRAANRQKSGKVLVAAARAAASFF